MSVTNPNAFFLHQEVEDPTVFLRLDRLANKAARVVFNGRVAAGMPNAAEIDVLSEAELVRLRNAINDYLAA